MKPGRRAGFVVVLAAVVWPGVARAAGPLEFGLSEYRKALQERGLAPERNQILTEYSMVLPADGFSIMGNIVRGGNLRGLMYGLLEAADQIRRQGRLSAAKVEPASPMRGIRWFLHNEELERGWVHDREQWRALFEMLARNRFNRFNLVFAHQTDYLAPPYPYWVKVPEFPGVRARGFSDEQREQNLATLKFISQTAVEFGVDFTLGVWEHDVQRGMTPSVEGLTADNLGPYSYAALKMVLAACPGIRSVQMRTNSESGIPSERQVEFYRDYVFRALRETGHLVQLDLRGWLMQQGLMEAALSAQVPLRLSSKYWAEDLGRPYPPAETWPNYSFLNFLEKPPVSDRPRLWQFYWELWALGSHRLLLWGDPDYVKRAAGTFTMSGAQGFEIDAPMAQKGFGNAPGMWGVFTEAQKARVFWKWEWQRYWLFYLLWGRLSFNPEEPERLWLDEFQRRFGGSGKDVFEAVRQSSKVLNELVAVHLADPNMYIWPEVNPGGLIDSYLEVRPSDWRMVAGFAENAQNRMHGVASAKQRPLETSEHFHEFALRAEQATARAQAALGDGHVEWSGTKPDVVVLTMLAKYHGRRQMAADHLAWFDATADETALYGARREINGALRVWQDLVKLTDGLYPAQMAFGPEDVGHWKDKLPYVQHDVKTVEERVAVYEKFGRFAWGFDFGPPPGQARPGSYRQTAYVGGNQVAPRFQAVTSSMEYREDRGFGWLQGTEMNGVGPEAAPYAEVRAVSATPKHLPENVLFGDSVSGKGTAVLRVKTGEGEFTALLLKPDGSVDERKVRAQGGLCDIAMPAGDWQVSGLILKGDQPAPQPSNRWPAPVARPALEHSAMKLIHPGKPLQLLLRVWPATEVTQIRLHYRALNQMAQWKVMETTAQKPVFTIPGEEIDARWDLQYYFEVLNHEGTGWFLPDPAKATPYYVVSVQVEVPAEPVATIPPPDED
jgi:hypothetical protein